MGLLVWISEIVAIKTGEKKQDYGSDVWWDYM